MLSFSTRQQNVLDAASKRATWLFDLATTDGDQYHWSTRTVARSERRVVLWAGDVQWADGVQWGDQTISPTRAVLWDGGAWEPGTYWYGVPSHDYQFRVVDFTGVTLSRPQTEYGLIAPGDMALTVLNGDGLITMEDLRGAEILVSLVGDAGDGEEVLRRFRFRVRRLASGYKTVKLYCESFYAQYLKGDWPNTPAPYDLFPDDSQPVDDDYCLPVVFGTAYVPIRSCWIDTARFYLLGESGPTYTVSKVRSPHAWSVYKEWDSGSYTFTQADKASGSTTVRVVSPVIADSNGDSSADSAGVWQSGGAFYDMPARFSRSDTSGTTGPAAVLKHILKSFGVSETDLDLGSFASAATVFSGWGLAWQGGFWEREDRQALLSRLLAMCAGSLSLEDRVVLRTWNAVSVRTVDSSEIIGGSGAGSFVHEAEDEPAGDSGYVAWQRSGASQALPAKYLVPAKSSTDAPGSDVLLLDLVTDSVLAQKLACLHYQKSLLANGSVTFQGFSSLLGLQPGDVVTVSDALYGGSHAPLLVNEVSIAPDLAVTVVCATFSDGLDDFGDLSFSTLTIPSDATAQGATFIDALDSSGAAYA